MMYWGLDLTSSPKRPSALVALDGDLDVQGRGLYGRDDEILSTIAGHSPALVAIDAPLSLPLGLCCLELDCPCKALNDAKGRACERQLSKRGISSYYTTKKSIIKEMVHRGLRLKEMVEKKGIGVIEVYPYATKTILFGRLPKKRSREGRWVLQEGLRCLMPSLPSPEEELLDHDTLDAIVSAYTAYLYQRGETEALGDSEEGLIHIPHLPLRGD